VNYLKEDKLDEPQIFLISNNNSSEYDFPILMDTLINDLPAQKCHNFTLSLPNVTEAAIDRKRESLRQFIWLEALKAGTLVTISTVGIIMDNDLEKLETILNHYQALFGVDDVSLEVFAKDLQVPVEQLKEIIKSPTLLKTKNEETIGGKSFEIFVDICFS
jgi:hypothetical protein